VLGVLLAVADSYSEQRTPSDCQSAVGTFLSAPDEAKLVALNKSRCSVVIRIFRRGLCSDRNHHGIGAKTAGSGGIFGSPASVANPHQLCSELAEDRCDLLALLSRTFLERLARDQSETLGSG
jgi:hypothetical protein